MSTKHTPRPWEICNMTDIFTQNGATNAQGVKCDDNDGWMIADCAVGITMVDGEEHQLDHKEQVANARLIAAAPDLLEALGVLHDAVEMLVGKDAPSLFPAKAAIAKATGEESP